MLDQILAASIEVEFLVDNRALARKLQAANLPIVVGDPKRTDTYLKADVSPQTCIIIEDSGRKHLPKMVEAVRDAGGPLIYILGVGTADREKRAQAIRDHFPDVSTSRSPNYLKRRSSPNSAGP
jgi:hypothetical protein